MSIIKKVIDDGRVEFYFDMETGRYTYFRVDENGEEHVFGDERVARRYWERHVLSHAACVGG